MKLEQRNTAYEHLTWKQVEQIDKGSSILILPIGSFEQHGLHLPLITDTKLAVEVCNLVSQKVANTYVLPPIVYSHSLSLTGYPGTISLKPETLYALLSDILTNLCRDGFRRIILFNTHGGNHKLLLQWVTEWNEKFSSLHVEYIFWGEFGMDVIQKIKETEAWGHACEIETSMCLALFPELVNMQQAVETPTRETNIDPRANPQQFWLEKYPYGSIGNPKKATAAKGEQILKAVLEELITRIADSF